MISFNFQIALNFILGERFQARIINIIIGIILGAWKQFVEISDEKEACCCEGFEGARSAGRQNDQFFMKE